MRQEEGLKSWAQTVNIIIAFQALLVIAKEWCCVYCTTLAAFSLLFRVRVCFVASLFNRLTGIKQIFISYDEMWWHLKSIFSSKCWKWIFILWCLITKSSIIFQGTDWAANWYLLSSQMSICLDSQESSKYLEL